MAAELADDLSRAVEVARLYRAGLCTRQEALAALVEERGRYQLRQQEQYVERTLRRMAADLGWDG